MNVEILFEDGTVTVFEAEKVRTINDVAFVDGVLQTDVDSMQVLES